MSIFSRTLNREVTLDEIEAIIAERDALLAESQRADDELADGYSEVAELVADNEELRRSACSFWGLYKALAAVGMPRRPDSVTAYDHAVGFIGALRQQLASLQAEMAFLRSPKVREMEVVVKWFNGQRVDGKEGAD